MALNKVTMATNVVEKLIAAGITPSDEKAETIVIWTEICDGIISELTTNGVVTTDVDGTDYTGAIT